MVEQNKRARANGEVKQEQREEEEVEEGEVSQEESQSTGPFPLLTVAAMEQTEEETQIDVRIAVALLHCHACLLPLKPPVFKCDEAHIVCSGCRCGHHGRAAVYTHCAELDAIVATAKVPCAYAPYGCHSYIVYAAVTDHQRACPCAPCSCPEPGCCFRNSPATLLGHFAADHSWPVAEISYGKPFKLAVPPPRGGRSHVLVGEADRALFLVSSCAVGGGHRGVRGVRQGERRHGGGGAVQVQALGGGVDQRREHDFDGVDGEEQRPLRRVPGGGQGDALVGAAGDAAQRVRRDGHPQHPH